MMMNLTNPPLVSLIIPAKNEGIHLKNTIDSINAAKTKYPYEIVVVDDGSDDHCCDFLCYLLKEKVNTIKLITTKGLGSAMARNLGADVAVGEYFIFCDAHLTFQDNWMDFLLEPIVKGRADAVNPGIGDTIRIDNIGYGYTWDQNLDPKWNVGRNKAFYSPLLAGGCLAISKKAFFDVGGFEKGFRVWGREDEEFSLKLWLFGYRCMVQPKVTILHLFRPSNPPFKITWDDINWNLLRMAYSHFNLTRIEKCKRIIKNSDANELEKQLLKTNIIEQRNDYLTRRNHDDNWYMKKFRIQF